MGFFFGQIQDFFQKKIFPLLIFERFNIFLLIIGVVLRLKHYLENRSFWLDETYVGIQVTSSSLMELLTFKGITMGQPQTPLFFNLVEKILTLLLGNHEYALRLFPFLSGICALFLFYFFAKHLLDKKVVPIALAFFVFSDYLIYYSAELKPYSMDVAVAIFLFFMGQKLVGVPSRKGEALFLKIAGILAICFSHASLFVLGGIGLTLFFSSIRQKDWRQAKRLLVVYGYWFCCFLVFYMGIYKSMAQETGFIKGNKFLIPYPLFSAEAWKWLVKSTVHFWETAAGFSPLLVGVVIFSIGAISIFKSNKEKFFIFTTPFLLAFLASLLHKYPFEGRFFLFSIPIVFVFFAQGVNVLLSYRKKFVSLITIVLTIVLLLNPITMAADKFRNGRKHEQNRQVMQWFAKHYKKGDTLFINMNGQFPFWYYMGQLNIIDKISTHPVKVEGILYDGMNVITFYDDLIVDDKGLNGEFIYDTNFYNQKGFFRGVTNQRDKEEGILFYRDSVLDIKPKRAWLYFSHVKPDTEKFILDYFDRSGKRVDAYEKKGTAVYLYDFSK